MPHAYANIAFTPAVRDMQRQIGSRENSAQIDGVDDRDNRLGQSEIEFIAARDSFYQATVSETGWPYVQFRGGPIGFLKLLNTTTLGYADFRGNMQYISVGNYINNDRISIILMDYENRARLKILGRVRVVNLDDDPELIAKLESPSYRARVQRGVLISVEGFDWNCPQHITPRFSEVEIFNRTVPLQEEIARLKLRLEAGKPEAVVPAMSGTISTIGFGPLAVVISSVRQLTSRVRAYELRAADDSKLPPVAPGAHIDLPVRLIGPDKMKMINGTRRYSITAASEDGQTYEVAVQLDRAGRGGSIAVHRDYQVGVTLNCSRPNNDFMLHTDYRPTVLIAGGIGITPIYAMTMALTKAGRAVALHYAARSHNEAALVKPLTAALGGELYLSLSDAGSRLDLPTILASAPANSVFYVCGPSGLIEAVRMAAISAGISAERIRFERFTAAVQVTDTANEKPVHVKLRRSQKIIEVSATQSILDAVQAAGVDVPASCRAGTCGTCSVKVIDGTPEHRDTALTTAERVQASLMCICVSRASSPTLTLDI